MNAHEHLRKCKYYSYSSTFSIIVRDKIKAIESTPKEIDIKIILFN